VKLNDFDNGEKFKVFRDKFLWHRDYTCHLAINIMSDGYYSVLSFFIAYVDEQGNEKMTSSEKDAYSMLKKVQETVQTLANYFRKE